MQFFFYTASYKLSLSSRPGSVVADVQLEVASPNMSVIFDVVSAMDNLGNFSLDRNETKMTIVQGIFTELSCMHAFYVN